MWVVANKSRTRFLAENEDGEVFVTDRYIDSIAFDDRSEAKENLDLDFFDEEFTVQLR